jgi:hypothetical protein
MRLDSDPSCLFHHGSSRWQCSQGTCPCLTNSTSSSSTTHGRAPATPPARLATPCTPSAHDGGVPKVPNSSKPQAYCSSSRAQCAPGTAAAVPRRPSTTLPWGTAAVPQPSTKHDVAAAAVAAAAAAAARSWWQLGRSTSSSSSRRGLGRQG